MEKNNINPQTWKATKFKYFVAVLELIFIIINVHTFFKAITNYSSIVLQLKKY